MWKLTGDVMIHLPTIWSRFIHVWWHHGTISVSTKFSEARSKDHEVQLMHKIDSTDKCMPFEWFVDSGDSLRCGFLMHIVAFGYCDSLWNWICYSASVAWVWLFGIVDYHDKYHVLILYCPRYCGRNEREFWGFLQTFWIGGNR